MRAAPVNLVITDDDSGNRLEYRYFAEVRLCALLQLLSIKINPSFVKCEIVPVQRMQYSIAEKVKRKRNRK